MSLLAGLGALTVLVLMTSDGANKAEQGSSLSKVEEDMGDWDFVDGLEEDLEHIYSVYSEASIDYSLGTAVFGPDEGPVKKVIEFT